MSIKKPISTEHKDSRDNGIMRNPRPTSPPPPIVRPPKVNPPKQK